MLKQFVLPACVTLLAFIVAGALKINLAANERPDLEFTCLADAKARLEARGFHCILFVGGLTPKLVVSADPWIESEAQEYASTVRSIERVEGKAMLLGTSRGNLSHGQEHWRAWGKVHGIGDPALLDRIEACDW